MTSARSLPGILGLIAGVASCGPVGSTEPTTDRPIEEEAAAQAQQLLDAPTCVTIQRGGAGNVFDTKLRLDQPATSFGGLDTFVVGAPSAGRIALLRFDLSPIPSHRTITSAVATLDELSNLGAAGLDAHLVASPWNEGTVTWNSFQSAYAPAITTSFLNGGAGHTGAVSFDLTAPVQAWYSGASNNGLALVSPSNSTWASSESASPALRPSLKVCFTLSTCFDGVQNHGETGLDCGGACAPCNPCNGVTCHALDQCHAAGTCNPATGACSNPAVAGGTACNDGDPCTQTDVCQSGACVGTNPVVCAPLGPCHAAGACDATTGACSSPLAADGTACDDGNACSPADTCQAGVCVGTGPGVCSLLAPCSADGDCVSGWCLGGHCGPAATTTPSYTSTATYATPPQPNPAVTVLPPGIGAQCFHVPGGLRCANNSGVQSWFGGLGAGSIVVSSSGGSGGGGNGNGGGGGGGFSFGIDGSFGFPDPSIPSFDIPGFDIPWPNLFLHLDFDWMNHLDFLDLNVDGTPLFSTSNGSVSITRGRIDVSGDLDLHGSVDPIGMAQLGVSFAPQLTGEITVDGSFSAADSKSGLTTLWEDKTTWVQLAGLIPVVEVLTVGVDLGYEFCAGGAIDVQGGAVVSVGAKGGFDWSRTSPFIPVAQVSSPSFAGVGPTVALQGATSLKVFLRPRVSVSVYGLGGPGIALRPYARFNAGFQGNQCPPASWALGAGVGLELFGDLGGFGMPCAPQAISDLTLDDVILASGTGGPCFTGLQGLPASCTPAPAQANPPACSSYPAWPPVAGVNLLCGDGVLDGNETGVDCGGSCAPCGLGSWCLGAGDCLSLVCAGNACAAPTCSDGIANGGETGVDCGGPCALCNLCPGVVCQALDPCHVAGACDPVAGACTNPTAPDGTACPGGICGGGACASCATTFFRDADGDGHGDPSITVTACTAPAGYVSSTDDCDDTRADVHPGAIEVCDAVDNDCNGQSEAPAVAWTTALGLPYQTPIAADAVGNTFVVGAFTGTLDLGGGPLVSAGGTDIFIARLDASGHHVWSRRFGDAADQSALGVAVDAQGGVLVTGSFTGTVDFGGGPLVSVGGTDVLVARFDAAGNHIMSRRFGGAEDDRGVVIVATPGGGYVVGGAENGSASGADGFVAAFDSAGQQIFLQSYAGAGYSALADVAVDAQGNVIVFGSFQGVAVAKYSPSGALLWLRSGTMAIPAHVGVDGAGNIVVAGALVASQNFVFDGATVVSSFGGPTGFFVLALDAAGNKVRGQGYTSGEDDVFLDGMTVDTFGRTVIVGHAWGDLDLGNGPFYGAFLGVLDPSGAFQWSQLGFAFDDVAVDSAGRIYTSGGGAVTAIGGQSCQIGTLWYRDADHDGYGDAAASLRAQVAPLGYVATSGDCNDLSASVHPGVPERCNGVDDDCDGNVDDGAVTWAHRYGDGGLELPLALAVDAQGNTVVAGILAGTIDFGDGPIASAGTAEGFVAKLDPAGNAIWSQARAERDAALAIDGAGNVLLASTVSCDLRVVKLDPAGNPVWTRDFPWLGGSCSTIESIAADGAGDVVFGGNLRGTQDFGGGAVTRAGVSAAYIVKLDPAGSHVYTRQFSGLVSSWDNAEATAVAADAAGDAFLTGGFNHTADFGQGPVTTAGDNDAFVVKLDPAGGTVWARTMGSAGDDDLGRAVAVDSAGRVSVVGTFAGTGTFGGAPLSAAGYRDVFIAAFDAAGAPVYSRELGASSSADVDGIALDGSGDLIIGWADFTGTGVLGVLTRLGPSGATIWQKRNPVPTAFLRVAADAFGNILAAGAPYHGVTVELGTGPLTGAGLYNVVVAKFAPLCLP